MQWRQELDMRSSQVISDRERVMAAIGQLLAESVLHTGFVAENRRFDDGLSIFVNVRTRLFAIACRMLGCAAEAEDIVQDVWLRWQSTNQTAVENPPAFLAKTTTRLCINLLQSARSRRERCVGSECPEPVDEGTNPGLGAERNEALNHAVSLLLQKLSPRERAALMFFAKPSIITIVKSPIFFKSRKQTSVNWLPARGGILLMGLRYRSVCLLNVFF
jgi:hypothetical protein